MSYLILKPRLTAKSFRQSQDLNTYVFDVPKKANKAQIKETIEASYQVRVVAVRVANIKGSRARSRQLSGRARQQRRPLWGHRTAIRKAYVTIAAGGTIPVFVDFAKANQDNPGR